MIWATVSSRCCFSCLYRVSPSSAANNRINLISVLTIWWCPCVESSRVVARECLLWSVSSLGKTVSLCPASFCIPRPNLTVTSSISWLPTFAFQFPMMKRTSFLVLVLEGLTGLHRTIQLRLLWHCWLGHRWGLLFYWTALETNRDHSVILETAPKYCILNSFVDSEGYSISSKGFLPTVVDIMVIWIKFAHSGPFWLIDC